MAQTPTNREKSKNKPKEFEEYNNRNPKNPKPRKFNLKSLSKVGQLLIKLVTNMAWVARALRSREQIITSNICCDTYTADFVFYFQKRKLHDFRNHVFFKIIVHNCTISFILVKHMKLGLKF